jgi:peroxiredoxin Q/BCP
VNWLAPGGPLGYVPRVLSAGDRAPDFAVKDSKGVVHQLADYAGKTLVIWFFPAADTPG